MRPGKNILLCAALGLLALGLSTSGAVELTRENYAELTAGKSVLLKLYAPWCTHCKAIKPAWDALMKQYEGHADVLVAESDCTAAGKTLCEDLQVQGYPSLKFGDPAALTDYQGARDLDGLKKFAASELRPACSLSRIELCDAEKRAQLEMLQAMPAEDLNAEIEKSEREIAAVEAQFKAEVERLQADYKKLQDDKSAAVLDIKSSGLAIMKAIRAANAKSASAPKSDPGPDAPKSASAPKSDPGPDEL